MVEYEDGISNFFPFVNLLLTFALGIPLYFSADVFSYAKDLPRQKKYILYGTATLILVAIYFSLPGFDSTQNTSVPYVRYTIYSIALHLLVAFIPFLGAGQLNGFWNYNKMLFIRIVAALLYSGVLYAGLAAALGSLDFLFDMDVHEELYFDLFILIGGILIHGFSWLEFRTTLKALTTSMNTHEASRYSRSTCCYPCSCSIS
jgi:hypothetical protein